MSSTSTKPTGAIRQPSVRMGIFLYLGYLAVFFTTWIINGVDYNRIGENAETTKLWYALPTLFGVTFLVIAISISGWWRPLLFEKSKSGPGWLWVLPIVIAGIILLNFATASTGELPTELLLWSALGAVGVGFGEEMITRGGLLAGLRSRFPESRVWLVSTLMFSALHIPNVLFGVPLWALPIQLLLTFIMGSAFYLLRRMSGTLIVPMVFHGLWDSSLFLNAAAGKDPSGLQFAAYPLAIACLIGFAVKERWWRDEKVRAA